MKGNLAKTWASIVQILALRSLRARIFALILIVGVVPSVVMRFGIVENYEERAVDLRTTTVQNQLKILANHLISNNYLDNYRSDDPNFLNSREVISAELETLSSLYEGRVMIINSNCKIIEDTYGISMGKTMISEEVIKCFRGENTAHYDSEHGYIEMTIPIIDKSNDDEGKIVGVMLTSVSSDSIWATMDILNRKAIILEMLMIMVILGLAIVLSGVLTRPFNRVTEEINKVQAGHSDESISVPDYVETVHIVEAFNQLLKRMKVLDDSRQEFVANVSHELKTPMTSLKVLADSLLMQENAPAELYREFMTDMVSEIDRENRIITDLLALVKMDKKTQELNITSLNINDLTELILKRLRPLARKMDVEVVFESNRPVVAEVDEVKLTLVITNLVENAIKYNKEHGWVKVVLDADHQFFTLEISDSGLGIPEEALAHVYERFYRVDKSHSREIGGTGLGLAITKNAVLMHKGSITASSTEGEGSVFTVKIPLMYLKSTKAPERRNDRMKKKILFLMILCLLWLGGCNEGEVADENAYQVYYINSGETKVLTKNYEVTSTDPREQVEELVRQMSRNPENVGYKAPFAMGYGVKNITLTEGKVMINMDEKYLDLAPTTEVLVRAAIVRTLTQLPDISHVGITVEGNQFYDNVGELVGWMNGDQFIQNDGNEINTYELTKVKLYFANAGGDKLIVNYREKHYSTNTPLERFIVEELIAGPSGQVEGIFPSVNPETKIINVMTKDGICYVNLDSSFLSVVNNVSTEISIYAIANSLIELNNISKVQVLINGEVPDTFSTTTYERNLECVTTLENEKNESE